MKKYFLLIFFLLINIGFQTGSVYAAQPTHAAFIGADTDQNMTNNDAQALHVGSDYSFFSTNDLSSLWGDTTTTSITDATNLSINANGALKVVLLQNDSNLDTQIDTLGYVDMLLILGLYDVNVTAFVHAPDASLTENVKAYGIIRTIVPSERVAIANKALGIYFQLAQEVQSNAKASQIFFTIIQQTAQAPDIGLSVDSIIQTSLVRERVTVSDTTKATLLSWEKDYLSKGQNWNGFFREISLYKQTSTNIITVSYKTLPSVESYLAQPNGDPLRNKIFATIIFVLFLVILFYFVYKNRGSNSKTHNT